MKKLLVILLLFFPVHGAWAEKIKLSCVAKDGDSNFFELDLQNRNVKNQTGRIISFDLNFNENSYTFSLHETMIAHLNEVYRKEEIYYKMEYNINRFSGELTMIFEATRSDDNHKKMHRIHAYSVCNVLKTEKKF